MKRNEKERDWMKKRETGERERREKSMSQECPVIRNEEKKQRHETGGVGC